MPPLSPLPIDELIPSIQASLQAQPNLLLIAEPGAGKTTRVPAALLTAYPGHVLVLEPRRLAARLAARRVAAELGEEVGQSVGFQVRYERVAGPSTRLHFLTEGVLTRRLLSDPDLSGVDVVVLDEFHERHLETDLALALLVRLQQRRPALRLLLMSATLDAEPLSAFLGNCPVLNSRGRQFPIAIDHLPYSPAPLEEQVRSALERLLTAGEAGNILVFLPGAAEIRRAQRACAPLAQRYSRLLLPLFGDLPPAEQDRAVAPCREAKIILATNVAESSVTIDGVTAVVDSGLARNSSWSPWTGLPTLTVGRVSQASATQRAGRAGRQAPGRVLRLYPLADYNQRPAHHLPEVQRADLTQLCLLLRSMGQTDPAQLRWLSPPPEAALAHAQSLLNLLGATGPAAAQLNRLPVHPRLARMIQAATQRGVAPAACLTAALLESRARRTHTDLLSALDEPMDERTKHQLRALLRLAHPATERHIDDEALLQSVLLGFPDRVARRRTGNQVMLANGVTAEFTGSAPPWPFLVALDVEDRSENALPQIRLAARLELDWLLDHFPDRLRDEQVVVWNRQAERVDSVSRLLYCDLVLEESTHSAPDPALASALLAEKALEAGLERFVDPDQLQDFLGRAHFAGITLPNLALLLAPFCLGMRSFADLRSAASGFFTWLEQSPTLGLPSQHLRTAAPTSLKLPTGRQLKIHYEAGNDPWVESRLQDFFGMTASPLIGPNRTPVVLRLLAPNRRPVQITTDLAGFWQRHYPSIRRELMRRYPRHNWTENPLQSDPR